MKCLEKHLKMQGNIFYAYFAMPGAGHYFSGALGGISFPEGSQK